jgi:hypothetical protein
MQQQINDNYIKLAGAIIEQVCEDYAIAVKFHDERQIKVLEKWFLGDWCDALTMGNGAYILQELKRQLGVA